MNYLLLLAIVGICIGAYYQESTVEKARQDKITAEQKLAELTDQYNQLLTDNQKLKADEEQLKKDLHDSEAKVAGLNTQIDKLHDTTEPKAPPRAVESKPKLSNSLGTIITQDGRTFHDCQLLKVESDGITFNHSEGITKVLYPLLPPAVQKRFGFDPKMGVQLPQEQVELMEDQRMAASQSGAN
ncbi:MAG: hypothetical protein LV479_07745 [Methylacidiphilales bacterium]|nr:hypothetical protein [Candidatus Methylacidiphilales bacterium]